MTSTELFESMKLRMSKAHEKVYGAAAMLDPTLIMGWIGAIIEMIRGCRSPETARANISNGTPISYTGALKVLRRDGYRGEKLREMARELALEGSKMKEPELDALIKEAGNAPAPTPPVVQDSWWPMCFLLAMLLIPSQCFATDVGFWPIDDVQNKRLDKLEASHDELEKLVKGLTIGKPDAPVSGSLEQITYLAAMDRLVERLDKIADRLEPKQAKSITKPALPSAALGTVKTAKAENTGICNCQGKSPGTCYCLKAGQKCAACTTNVGSIWELTPEGKPIAKTGEYANPNTGQKIAKPAPTANAMNVAAIIPAQQYTYQCNNGRCRRVRLFR